MRPPSPASKTPFLKPSRIGTAPLHLSSSRLLYGPFSSFALVASSSSYIPHPHLAVSLLPRRVLPPHLCLSRPSRSPSLDPSLSPPAITLLLPPRPPRSVLPSRLPGFYLSLVSTRSLSGNERRNTLATFNRPALSSAYTYLAGSGPLPTPSSSSPSFPPPPRPPSCHPRASPARPRLAPTLPLLTSHLYHQHRI